MSATDTIDAVNSIHLLASGSVGITLETGKVGNALQTTQRLSLDTFDQTLLKTSSAPNPQFAISGWIKPGTGSVATLITYENDDPPGEDFIIQLQLRYSGTNAGRLNVYRNTVGTDESLDIDGIIPLTGSGWFFFVFQQANFSQFQYSINGSTLADAGGGLVFPNSSKAFFQIESNSLGGLTGQTVQYDEIAIWGGSLSQLRIAALYNSGTGVTWPVLL